MNKEILRLAVPNILTNLTVPLVSAVDLALMGRLDATSYIIAIGFGTMVFNFIYWAFGFLRMGTTGIVSQAFGASNHETVSATFYRGIIVALLVGFVLIFIREPIAYFTIELLQAEESIASFLLEYFFIRIYAAPATIAIFVISGWLLGLQDAKSSFLIAISINLLNVVLSYYLVQFEGMAIRGIAIGTLVAQYTGVLIGLLIIAIKHKKQLGILKRSYIDDWSAWKAFLQLNGHIFIRTMCLIFVMSFFKTKAGNIDPIMGAANILLIEFITLSAYGIDGFAFAAESLCGKYFGLKNKILLKESIKVSFLWGSGLAVLFALVFYLFGRNFLLLLTNNYEVVNASLTFLPWLVMAPIINAVAFIWDGVYIGTTASKAMQNTLLIATLIVFLPAYYFTVPLFGNHGLWFSLSAFMLSRGIIQTYLAPKVIFQRIN